MSSLGLYIHIPFCARRCSYCDFVSYPWHEGEEGEWFVQLLLGELSLRIQSGYLGEREIQSVYFGGGTPSLLHPSCIGDFLSSLRAQGILAPYSEVTLEVNPEDITFWRLEEWRTAGVTRLSVGVQSLQFRYLVFLGRSTSPQRIKEALETIRRANWENWNVDLMYGLPLQDFDVWQEDVRGVLQYAPPHVSIYSLTVEPWVPLAPFFRRHRRLFPSPDMQAYLFRLAERILNHAGYVHYEVSNFALPGFECRHNLLYWRNGEYVGLGPSAWTYCKGRRQKNIRSLRAYTKMVRSGKLPVIFEEELPRNLKDLESIALLLRTNQGLPVALLSSQEWGRCVQEFLKEGLLYIREGCLYPSSRGYLLLHQVLSELFARGQASKGA